MPYCISDCFWLAEPAFDISYRLPPLILAGHCHTPGIAGRLPAAAWPLMLAPRLFSRYASHYWFLHYCTADTSRWDTVRPAEATREDTLTASAAPRHLRLWCFDIFRLSLRFDAAELTIFSQHIYVSWYFSFQPLAADTATWYSFFDCCFRCFRCLLSPLLPCHIFWLRQLSPLHYASGF